MIGGGNALLQTATQFDKIDKALTSVTGSAGASAAQMAFVQDTAKRLGIGLVSTADGYVKLTAAAQGTELQGEKTQQIFTAVAKASAALGLSSEDTSGALLAIGQMMSKGNVQAEELRGQLGERLPGAFQIAARAMGVSTAELQKMLEQGQVVATDFLPRFAAELDKTYANARFDGIQNNINRIGTEWDLLKARMADTLPIKAGVEALAGALAALNKELDKTPLEAAQGRLAEANALGLSGGPNEKRVAQLQAEQSALFRRIGGSGSRFNDSVPDIASVNLAGSLSAGSFNVGASDSFSPGAAFNRAVGLQNTQQAMAGALQTYEQLHAATERAAQGTQKLAGAELAMAKATLAADEAHARRTHNTQALVDILAKQQMAEHGYTEEQARAIAQNKVREEQEKAGLSTSNKAATAAQTLSEKINDIVAGYTKEAGAVGLSAREAAVYEAEQKAIIGLTAQQIEQLKAQPEYWNRLRDAAGQAFDARQAQELDKYVKQLNGSIEDSVALDQQRMALMQSGVVGDALESELALRKKIADVTREMQDKGAGADAIAEEVSKIRSSWSAISGAAADAARKAQDDWKQTSQAIEQGLINALMAGFEKGKSFGQNLKDTLKALFKTLILEPVIRPIANGISQAVSGVVSNVVGSALGNSVSGLFGNGLSGIVGNVAGSALGSVVSDAGGGSPMVSSGGGGMGTIGNIASIGSLVNNATGWGTQALNSAGSTVSGWLGGS
ncbi:tape measure protein, partial [Methylogaea oryzae]|uniref:tape measure protein n=1 Tax=Methylogaea oryzae TaxID=1295382 RepID=UPI0006D25E96